MATNNNSSIAALVYPAVVYNLMVIMAFLMLQLGNKLLYKGEKNKIKQSVA